MHENEHTDHLEMLDALLNSDMVTDQAMSISQLDGFMAGIIVCPDPILPAQWIDRLWGEEGIDLDDDEQLRVINGVVIACFKRLLFGLYQGFVHPIYDQGDETGPDWSGWASGFAQAMAMRPEAWDKYGGHDGGLGDEDAQQALSTLKQLCAYAALPEGRRENAPEIDEKTQAMAPDLIPEAVLLLYGVKQASGIPIPVSLSDTNVKPGLNDPCPCGSGLTYEQCCLPKDREKRMAEAKRTEDG